jgi:hypothetical protein
LQVKVSKGTGVDLPSKGTFVAVARCELPFLAAILARAPAVIKAAIGDAAAKTPCRQPTADTRTGRQV